MPPAGLGAAWSLDPATTMHGAPLLACLALTLALLARGAPAPPSPRGMQLQQLQRDLELLQKGLSNPKNPKLRRMLTLPFYVPQEVTEWRHLQCLGEELMHLEEALRFVQEGTRGLKELMDNINVTAQALKGAAPSFKCAYGAEVVNVTEFLSAWVGFCQRLFLTAA